MEAGFIILAVVLLIVGIIVGFLIGKRRTERLYISDTQYTQGTLNVDCSNSETHPGIFLGLGVPVSDIVSRKYVKLDVKLILQKSHE